MSTGNKLYLFLSISLSSENLSSGENLAGWADTVGYALASIKLIVYTLLLSLSNVYLNSIYKINKLLNRDINIDIDYIILLKKYIFYIDSLRIFQYSI